jgi:cell division protein FtsW (lipid II flippase)
MFFAFYFTMLHLGFVHLILVLFMLVWICFQLVLVGNKLSHELKDLLNIVLPD